MARRLIILANAFPYGTWEPYLAGELPYFTGFDDIIIFSLSVRPEQAQTCRPLDNPVARAYPIRFRSRLVYLLWAFRAVADPNLWADLKRLIRDRRFSLSRLITLLVFVSRAHYEARQIRRNLPKLGVSPADELVFYAYRFAYQPYLAHLVGGGPIIARAHGADLYEWTAPHGYIPLRQAVLSCTQRVYAIAEDGRDYIMERYRPNPAQIVLSRLGTADHGLGPTAPGNTLRLVSCSTIVPVKRLDLLVVALARLDHPVVWTHFGTGVLEGHVRELAHRLPAHVTAVFRGQVANSEVLDDYARQPYDWFINVSASEGLPVSIMEVCSFGIPVIATDVGGTAEIVRDGCNGFLIDAEAGADVIAAALKRVALLDEPTRQQFRSAARQTWEAGFNADTNYRKFAAAVRSYLPSVGGATA